MGMMIRWIGLVILRHARRRGLGELRGSINIKVSSLRQKYESDNLCRT